MSEWMRWKPPLLYLLLVTVGIAAGFFWGSRVLAGGTEPGSSSDPLVARSYVDAQVATYIAGLQTQIANLTAQESQLEQTLAQLQRQQGITPIQPAPASPASSPAGVSSKLLYILAGNNTINVRQGPGTGYPVVGKADRGDSSCEPMTELSQSGDWYQVRLPNGLTGWVADWLVD